MSLIFLRSLVFNVVFYVNLIIWIIVAIPTLMMRPTGIIVIAKIWSRTSVWLMRLICGTRVEFRGMENIPAGPLVVASKHQSMWETVALLQIFDFPLFIFKRELARIPFFGWYLLKGKMIPVDRDGGARALIDMTREATKEVQSGRQLIIFPEGTRRPVDAPPDYKSGIAQIYGKCNAPCLPVALNSGLFWPRRMFLRYPGPLIVEFLPPIAPGVPRKEFMVQLSDAIETSTNRIVAEARAEQAILFGRVPSAPASDA